MTKAEQAAKMRAEGKSLDEIAEHFGWTRNGARGMCSRGANYADQLQKLSAYNRQTFGPVEKPPRGTRQATALRMREEGASIKEVAKAMGLTIRGAHNALRDARRRRAAA